MRFIKMVDFQLKLYVKNSYFVNLVIISTTTMLMYQYLAHYVNHNYSGKEWLIAGVMGTWASCTTSAGALGFQRWQGTLPIKLIYHQNIQNSFIIAFLIVVIFFIGVSKLLTNFVVKKAFKDRG